MRRIADWIDVFFDYDRRAIRALLLILAIPIVLIAAERGWQMAFPERSVFPEGSCPFQKRIENTNTGEWRCESFTDAEIKATAEAGWPKIRQEVERER